MATKTVAPQKTSAKTAVAVRKPSAGNIVSIQDALKAQVVDLANRVAPATGVKIRATQDKKFILPDGTTTPGPLKLVIVDFAAVNTFYEGPFNKDDVAPPACYAVGSDPRKMAPAANAPNKQASDCQSCPMNEWGSNGAGKACANGRLMAVLPPDADEDTPLWLLQASATAVKGFDGYVQGVARTFQSMPISVITEVAFDESVTYAKMLFSNPEPNPNVGEHFARQAEARELLFAERDVSGYKPVVAKPANGKKVGARR
jgi:hypothetical protein